jgi:hypothetical protein
MRPLVAVRHATPFEPEFVRRDARFWPLTWAAKVLEGRHDFPAIEALANVFDGDPPVRFVAAPPRRRRGAPVDARALYDARITLDRTVPTRSRCWHDLLNALVWGAFPLAKRALHARQHRAMARRLAPGSCGLPPTRTPEQDALALLDEGGVVVMGGGDDIDRLRGSGGVIVFGHAIYESLVFGIAPAVAAGLRLDVGAPPSTLPAGQPATLRRIDCALASAIEDETRLRSPRELRRLRVPVTDASA